jgi:hypothetical protein
MQFVIHGNLDAEARWAGGALPNKIAERVSPFAALLAHLAPPGTDVEIWAPAAVDAARVKFPATMRVGEPRFCDLAWAQPDAKPFNDRRFALALARELGCALPGARAIRSADEIDLAGPWVAKAPWTTAGRDRCFGTGREVPAELPQLLAKHGELVVEPWLERTLDVAICGDTEAGFLPPHRLVTSERGTFRGIELACDAPGELVDVAGAVANKLRAAGYCGPFGIDAFVHAGGFHPLCEINVRLTFGHVAHALGRRLGARVLGLGPVAPAGATILVEGAAWMT